MSEYALHPFVADGLTGDRRADAVSRRRHVLSAVVD